MTGTLGTVAHYELRSRLGAGGMGEVYLAHDQKLNRLVAIKFLANAATGAEARRRVLHEAQAAAALDHPNICAVHEVGTDEAGRDFIVMQYVEGETLAARLERGAMGVGPALELVSGIAAALEAAHEHGVIHRDLKPHNVVITLTGVPKLLDFGIARMDPAGDHAGLTTGVEAATISGTPGYIAPEVLRGRPADARSDLFSMGVVLYECLTGNHPFGGGTRFEVMNRVLNEEPERLSQVNASFSGGLDAVCRRLLAKEPGRRFQSAAEVCGALEVLRADVTPDRGPRRRWALSAAFIAATILTGIAVTGVWRTPGSRLPPAPPEAQEWYHSGIEAIREGAFVTARRALEEAVRIHPDYALAHSRLAEVLSALDEERAAQRALIRVSALVPDESRLAPDDRLRLVAIRAMVLREFDRAIRAYTELSQANPEDAGGLVDLGRAQEAAGHLADARQTYQRATALNTQLASGFLRLGSVLVDSGYLDDALGALVEADRLYALSSNVEGRVETLLERGAALDSAGHFEATAKAAEEASRLASTAGLVQQVIRAGFQSGSAQVGAGQFAAGLATLRTYVDQAIAAGLEGTAASGLIDMAGTLLANDRPVEAEAALVQARSIADERSLTRTAMRASTQQAALELDRNEPARALTLVEEPLRYFAQSRNRRLEAVALTIAARAHQALREYATAAAQLESVLAFADESHNDELRAQAQSSLATMALGQGRLPEAVEHRAAAIRLRRSLGDTETLPYDLTNHAEVLIRLGRGDEAAGLLDQVEAGIAAGTGAYPTRARRVVVLRALQAVTEGRFAAARQHLAPLVGAVARPGDDAGRLGLMLDAVAAASTGKRVSIPAVSAARDDASVTGRDLRWWQCIALAAAGDTSRASTTVAGLLREPAADNDEEAWRLSALAATLTTDASLAAQHAARARQSFDRLARQWDAAIVPYRGRHDLAPLLATITRAAEGSNRN